MSINACKYSSLVEYTETGFLIRCEKLAIKMTAKCEKDFKTRVLEENKGIWGSLRTIFLTERNVRKRDARHGN